jgi:hypothetical protein
MDNRLGWVLRSGGVLLGALMGTLAPAQQIYVRPATATPVRVARAQLQQEPAPKPPPGVRPVADEGGQSVYKIDVYQGPNRSVHYVTTADLPSSDRAAIDELQWAENERIFVQQLQRLRQQYVNSERILEPQRRYVQELLYGSTITSSWGGVAWGGGGYPGLWGGGYGGHPGLWTGGPRFGTGYFGGYGGWGGWPGAGWGGYGGNVSTMTRSLANGMGNEGVMKNSISPVIAQLASPDYAQTVLRNYNNAVARAASSDRLWKEPVVREVYGVRGKPGEGIKPAAHRSDVPDLPPGTPITLFVKGANEPIKGNVVEVNADWITVRSGKTVHTVRLSEVNRYETEKK